MFLDKIWYAVIYVGMPVVAAYHLVCSTLFLNVAAEDAQGLEKLGNAFLTPVHYLLAGKSAVREGDHYVINQKYDYQSYFIIKSIISTLAAPMGLTVGSCVKGLAYFSPKTRERHALLKEARTRVVSHLDEYRKLGLNRKMVSIDPPPYERSPGDEHHLAAEKEALCEIIALFNHHQIPYWLEKGACKGACQYGGVIPGEIGIDLAILELDFDNAMNLLQQLSPKKYQVQDWSPRSCPKTSLRLYIKENCSTIDFSVVKTVDTIFPLKKAYLDGIEVTVPTRSL